MTPEEQYQINAYSAELCFAVAYCLGFYWLLSTKFEEDMKSKPKAEYDSVMKDLAPFVQTCFLVYVMIVFCIHFKKYSLTFLLQPTLLWNIDVALKTKCWYAAHWVFICAMIHKVIWISKRWPRNYLMCSVICLSIVMALCSLLLSIITIWETYILDPLIRV
jgi:hypothetical protein